MRLKRDGGRALLVVMSAALLASCSTSGSDAPFGFSMSDIAPEAAQSSVQSNSFSAGTSVTSEQIAAFIIEDGDPTLPDAVIAAPIMRPGSEISAVAVAAAPATEQPLAVQQAAPGQPEQVTTSQPEPADINTVALQTPEQAQQSQTAAVEASTLTPEAAEPAKKRSFLSAFFAPSRPIAPQPTAARPLIDPTASAPITASAATRPAQPAVQPAAINSAVAATTKPLTTRNPGADANPLPGVRPDSLFEISRRSGIDDDSDIDLHEGDEPSYQLASAAGMARLAPNGLIKQTDNVDVACLKPSLVRVLKAIEKHYGRKVVVTSGYRSPDRNRQARGARNSLHMYCAAADVQVEGISKWSLAEYVRTMPGRGGVGTYCHTESVHIDVGPERDWNWRCRRRK